MRLIKNKRGQIRVIEAFFASVLLLSSLTLIPLTQRNSSGATNVLSSTAIDILIGVDNNGHLANLVEAGNWSAIQSCVQSFLPLTVWFNLTVFDSNMVRINGTLISSGGAVSDKIESADYVCASTSGNYAVYIIRLQLAAVG